MGLGMLLRKEDVEEMERDGGSLTPKVFCNEAKKLGWVAGPMVAVGLSQYLIQVVATMMVGHVDELSLASSALAISLCGVTGFSLLNGMACALETLCGQAYGAQQYSKLGTQTYTAIFSLLIVCLPLSVIWIFMSKILLFFGQDPLISQEAGKFTILLIPAIFAYAILQPLVRYFQMQSLMFPVVMSSFFAFALHIPLCWFLVFHTKLENLGGALAIDISIWSNVTFLLLYMKYSSICAKTRVPISLDVLRGVGEFFSFGIPSALMICLEWWSFEIMILLSGLLPNPKLETSVLSVCLNTMATMYAMPLGLGAAVSTRVSNELGAGNPQGARNSVYVVMSIVAVETSIVSAILLACRGVFGYVFTNDKTVVSYVTAMAPLVCLSVMMDGIQGVLTGVARGCGWQHLGAYVNLGAFYFWGIPVGVVLAFWFELRVKGLWIGIQSGILLQTVALAVITSCTNWERQAVKARTRLFDESLALKEFELKRDAV